MCHRLLTKRSRDLNSPQRSSVIFSFTCIKGDRRYLAQHSAFADVIDYSEFTAVVNPKALNRTNIVDILQVRARSQKSSSPLTLETGGGGRPGPAGVSGTTSHVSRLCQGPFFSGPALEVVTSLCSPLVAAFAEGHRWREGCHVADGGALVAAAGAVPPREAGGHGDAAAPDQAHLPLRG